MMKYYNNYRTAISESIYYISTDIEGRRLEE